MKPNRKYVSHFGKLKASNPTEYRKQKGFIGTDGYVKGVIQERVERTEANQKRNSAVQKEKKLKLLKKD